MNGRKELLHNIRLAMAGKPQFRNLPASRLDSFEDYWMKASSYPCPACFLRGKISGLRVLSERNYTDCLSCRVCRERFAWPAE